MRKSTVTFNLPAFLRDKTVSLFPGWIVILYLAMTGYGMMLWPLFGAANQILAGIALLAATVFLKMLRRPIFHYMIPFAIMIITSMVAMVHQIFTNYIPNEMWALVFIGCSVLICGLGVVIIALTTWKEKGSVPYKETA